MTDPEASLSAEGAERIMTLAFGDAWRGMGVELFDPWGRPMEWEQWHALHLTPDVCIVGRTHVRGKLTVSTVWSGLNYNFRGLGRPLIYETMTFPRGRYQNRPWARTEVMARYSTRGQAQRGHEGVVNVLRDRGVADGMRWLG